MILKAHQLFRQEPSVQKEKYLDSNNRKADKKLEVVEMLLPEETSIYRSESAIESEIMENLSLRFSVKLKHQSEVPIGREKTDTETAVTLVWNF